MRGNSAAAGNPPLFLRIRRLYLQDCGPILSPTEGTKDENRTKAFRLRATPFLLAEKKWGKETAKGNLSRRRFPLESLPIGQGAAAPLRSPGVYGGDGRRRTGGWTGVADCHSPLRGFAMTRDGGQEIHWGLSVSLTGRPQSLESNYLVLPYTETEPSRAGPFRQGRFAGIFQVLAFRLTPDIPANKDVNPASSPRPFPGPRGQRAYCRRGAGGNPARSPAWRR